MSSVDVRTYDSFFFFPFLSLFCSSNAAATLLHDDPAAGKKRRRKRKKLKRARNWVNLLTFALSAVCVCYSHLSSASHNDARDYEQRGKERPSIRDAFVIYARRLRSTVKARRERRLTLCITMMNESCRIDSRSSRSGRQQQTEAAILSICLIFNTLCFVFFGGGMKRRRRRKKRVLPMPKR